MQTSRIRVCVQSSIRSTSLRVTSSGGGRRAACHLRGLFERAAVLQISGDARRTKGVVADVGNGAGGFGESLNHRIALARGRRAGSSDDIKTVHARLDGNRRLKRPLRAGPGGVLKRKSPSRSGRKPARIGFPSLYSLCSPAPLRSCVLVIDYLPAFGIRPSVREALPSHSRFVISARCAA